MARRAKSEERPATASAGRRSLSRGSRGSVASSNSRGSVLSASASSRSSAGSRRSRSSMRVRMDESVTDNEGRAKPKKRCAQCKASQLTYQRMCIIPGLSLLLSPPQACPHAAAPPKQKRKRPPRESVVKKLESLKNVDCYATERPAPAKASPPAADERSGVKTAPQAADERRGVASAPQVADERRGVAPAPKAANERNGVAPATRATADGGRSGAGVDTAGFAAAYDGGGSRGNDADGGGGAGVNGGGGGGGQTAGSSLHSGAHHLIASGGSKPSVEHGAWSATPAEDSSWGAWASPELVATHEVQASSSTMLSEFDPMQSNFSCVVGAEEERYDENFGYTEDA